MSTNQDTLLESNLVAATNIRKVMNDCKQIVKQSNAVLKPISTKRSVNVKEDSVTLEKVVRDMTCVLNDLKNGIKLVKSSSSKTASSHNMENELENLYKKQEETKKQKEVEEQKKKDGANQQRNKKPGSIKQVQKKISNQGKQNVTQKRSSSADNALIKRGSNQSAQNKPNTSQKRASSAGKTLVKNRSNQSNQNDQTATGTKKRANSIESQLSPIRANQRPSSVQNDKNESKVIITTVKFPTEKVNVTANPGLARQTLNDIRQAS